MPIPSTQSLVDGDDSIICLYGDELEALLVRAADEGARAALARLKLDDPAAADDLHDMRSIVHDWRMVRTEALKRLINTAITVFVLGLAFLAARFGLAWGAGQ